MTRKWLQTLGILTFSHSRPTLPLRLASGPLEGPGARADPNRLTRITMDDFTFR